MNFIRIFSLILIVFMVGCNSTKESLFLKMPNLQKADSAYTMLKYYSEKYKNDDAVYINYDYNLDEFESGTWNWKQIYNYKYIILNPSNKEITTFSVKLGKGDLKNIFIKLTYPDGSTKFWGRQHLSEEKDSEGNLSYKVIYPNVQKGTIVEEGYEISYNYIKSTPSLEK